jgi:hypothetical protein
MAFLEQWTIILVQLIYLLLYEAEHLVKTRPNTEDFRAWIALLGALQKTGSVEMGYLLHSKSSFEVHLGNAASFMLLSNMYDVGGKWDFSV